MEDPITKKCFLNLSLFSKSTVICFNSGSNVNHSPVASLWTSLMWSHVKSSITPESSERDYLYSCRLLLSPSTKIKRRSSTVWFWSLSSEEKFFAGGQRAVRPDLVSQNSPPRDIHICLLKKSTHSLLLLLFFFWRFLLRPYWKRWESSHPWLLPAYLLLSERKKCFRGFYSAEALCGEGFI